MTQEPKPKTESPVRVGVAGWSYPDWEGTVYPKPKPRGFDPLPYLAQFIDAIEINSTFYRPATADNARKWAERVRGFERFRFTMKLWQRLTHEREAPGSAEISQARTAAEVLAGEGLLGAVLAQFPWSFTNTEENRARIAELAKSFADLNLAVEVRHGSWNCPPFYELLEKLGAALVNLDQPLIGSTIRALGRVTSRVGYVRFHGRNYRDWVRKDAGRDDRYNYLYSAEELKPWKDRIERMAGACDSVFAIANNHYRGQAAANAVMLKLMLGQEAEAPEMLERLYPPGTNGY